MDKAQLEKKKRIKRYITWGCMAALVALLAVMPLLAKNEAETDGPVASVLSGTVETGSIQTTLHGGGTLAADGVEEVNIPAGVKITEFLVRNDEYVTEGTPVAKVDKVSVMTAITGVRETLEYLQDELNGARDEKVSANIIATAGGRVKKLFAEPGDSVQDVMLEHGALALLSIDGRMAVKLEEKLDIGTGESVTVTLSDGTEVTGRVESNLDGVVIISMEDGGYAIGETVTIADNGGNRLGTGQLYIHNAWKATAYSGTISTVNAKEERTLSSGSVLFTLEDREFLGDMNYLAETHREYEELLQRLFRMYESGTLDAPCDGVISGVDQDSTHLLCAIDGEEGYYVDLLSSPVTEEKGWILVRLSASGGANEAPVCTNGTTDECPVDNKQPALHMENCLYRCTKEAGCPAKGKHHRDCLTNCTGKPDCDAPRHKEGCQSVCTGKTGCLALQAKHNAGCPEKCTNNANCISSRAKSEHGENCIIHCIKDLNETDGVCNAKHHYDVCIGNCIESIDSSCTALNHRSGCYFYNVVYTGKATLVTSVGNSELIGIHDPVTVYTLAPGWSVVSPALDTKKMSVKDHKIGISNSTRYGIGDVVVEMTATKGDNVLYSDVVVVYDSGNSGTGGNGAGNPDQDKNKGDGEPGQSGGTGGTSSMIGGFSGFGNYFGSAAEPVIEQELYDLEGSTLLTVIPRDTMTLTISLDEQDISKVYVGQKAKVTVIALPGEIFDAEVTRVGVTGTNSGGSSKFSVDVQLDYIEGALSGFSADAVIALETHENVPVVPVAALDQLGGKTVVYTALDEKTGEPTSPVEVEIGFSDEEYAELLSGLELGDTYYYSFYDTLELDTSAEAERYTFG